jgi:hypothetical protein
MSVTATSQPTTIPNWAKRVGNESDPNNREITAYLLGIEDRKIAEKKELETLFLANLEMCCYYSTKFFDYITKEKKKECIFATIKAESIDKFHSIFVLLLDDYKDIELRRDLYKLANMFRAALKSKDICFEISLMCSLDNSFDKTPLYADGFSLEYNAE